MKQIAKRRPSTLLILILCFLFILIAACSSPAINAAEPTPTPIPTPVIPAKPTYQVQRGEMTHQLQFSGRFVPASSQEISFGAGGIVKKVYVQRGDDVTEGQLLAELETDQSEYDLRRAETNLRIARLRLDLARLQTNLPPEVYAVTIAIQEQEVELAQIALDEISAAYQNVRLVAPFSGTVFSISISNGSPVDTSKPVMVIADLQDLVIHASVKGEEVPLLTVGMKVTVSAVGRNFSPAEGTIQALPYPYGTAEGSDVRITLAQSPVSLGYKVGDMVNMEVILEQKSDALWLPAQAVRQFEGRYFVIVQDGETQRRVDIKVGIIQGDRLEILEGLTEGQVVIAP